MSKTIKEQMTSILNKADSKNQTVKVTYKSVNIQDKDARKDALLAMEKKMLDARKVVLLEKEVENLKFKLSQQSDALENEKRRFLGLEQENSKLRGARTSSVEKVEKATSQNVLKSKEYKDLLLLKIASDSIASSLRNELTDNKKQNKTLCVEIARILKKLLKEASLPIAKESYTCEMLRQLKMVIFQ